MTNPVSPYVATTPPTPAPIAAPMFAATRVTALARWRRSGGESVATIVDWLGLSAPLPAPARAAARAADRGMLANASPTYPAASATPATAATDRAPKRSISGPDAGAVTTATPVMSPTTSPAVPRLRPRPSCR